MSSFKLNSPRDEPGYDITLGFGEYRFIFGHGTEHRIEVLRYGEPWIRIEQGNKAIISMLDVIERLETSRLVSLEMLKEVESDPMMTTDSQRIVRELMDELRRVQEG